MIDPLDYSPWDFWKLATPEAKERQRERIARLNERDAHEIGAGAFVSELASVDNERLLLGDRSYIAAGAYLTGQLTAGADCSINAYAVVRGQVRLGDGVRIGAHSSILGFNHTMSDPELPVFKQPLHSRGIRLGDDVWVGSHVVVLDGVTVGDHTVLAAGAVVTKDVADGAIVGGNPARFLKWRIPPTGTTAALAAPGDRATRLAAFARQAREQAPDILERSLSGSTWFVDRPGVEPTMRAQCDAVEIADLLLATAPPQLSADAMVRRLAEAQDASTGLVAPVGGSVATDDPDAAYNILAVGYALDLLGATFPHPLRLVTASSATEVSAFLGQLPWQSRAWHAGHWTDALGTALHWTLKRGDSVPEGYREALVGWLTVNADPRTGMWGQPNAEDGLLQVVNGFYRASRGTLAQFALPVPYPERVIDTVLQHARDSRFFAPERHDACNVLDVAHPLWLTRGADYRSDEVIALAGRLLDSIVPRWVDGEGFGFRAPGPDSEGLEATQPGLQGTEMWLATIWYLSDLCGMADALGYRPRGIHRPEAANRLN